MQDNFFKKQLVLVGGGHANVQVLRKLCMNVYQGLHTILINSSIDSVYSGMTPSFLQNYYSYDDITIDLQRLCFNAGATFIEDEVIELDTDLKKIILMNRPSLNYDLLSINTGSSSKLKKIKIKKNAKYILVKPINNLVKNLQAIDDLIKNKPNSIISIIGGGVAAFEISFALIERYGEKNSIKIISSDPLSEGNLNLKSKKKLIGISKKMGVEIYKDFVTEIMDDQIKLSCGDLIKSDFNLISTGAELPKWLLNSSLEKINGFIGVKNDLRSLNENSVFISGDAASIQGHTRTKSGVMAVRHGEVLKENIFLKLQNKKLKSIKPQKNWLYIIGTYKNKALLNYYNFTFHSKWCWLLKKFIDLSFIKKFSFDHNFSMKKKIRILDEDNKEIHEMHCQGCGSKASKRSLLSLLKNENLNKELADSSIVSFRDKRILQTIDHIKLFKSIDPYDFGVISYLHSQNDIIAAGGKVNSLNVSIGIPFSEQKSETFFLESFMEGIKKASNIDGSFIVSGHSFQTHEPGITINMNGTIVHNSNKSSAKENDLIYLSKPLGTGYLMNAYFKNSNLVNSITLKKIINYLKMSNFKAVEIAKIHNTTTMTDISGFGLASHLSDICISSGLTAIINLNKEVLIDSNFETLKNYKSTGFENNFMASSKHIHCDPNNQFLNILYDPQTNGPMLMVINQNEKNSFEKTYYDLNHSKPILLGNFEAKKEKLINIIN